MFSKPSIVTIFSMIALYAGVGSADNLQGTSDLNFLVMGDWGGSDKAPYTTVAEQRTAQGMDKIAGGIGARFTLALGDNFYYSGVTSLDDHRFNDTFENVFIGSNLQGENFFRLLAGNHDHNGNVTAQILYSNVSSRWHYPDYYYDFEEAYGNFKLHVIMLDTVIISGASETKEGVTLMGDEYEAPKCKLKADAQIAWLESTLEASDADIIIVAGHYPVWSICEHGPTATLLTSVKPLLEKYGVAAYLSGHDHCEEVIQDGDDNVVYHGIGSANFNDPSTAHEKLIPSDSLKFHAGSEETGGFARVLLKGDTGGLIIEHYDGDGTLKYTADEVKIRTNK
ncbi:hypothetical protein TrST_g8542 [Triparma strigata]|uniref:acid phosphatase n=1 Tax=Triparma strigata TaxID=1606541 RepID=A0A9W7EI12_9STRA|nr:hypothetical protein TrST_g8542 [Triparma strigata]